MKPIMTKMGRNYLKHYVCVFSYLATRALHLEVAFLLNTSSFLLALQRFMSRRGKPETLVSDNGTNFVGANRLLREGVQRMQADRDLQRKQAISNINWKFNPPRASHQGGVFERMIRSVRKIFSSLVSEKNLNDEKLLTLMTEVERILNSRPITPVSSDPSDMNALTPNALLMGRLDSSIAMDVFAKSDGYKRSWRAVNWMAEQFWASPW